MHKLFASILLIVATFSSTYASKECALALGAMPESFKLSQIANSIPLTHGRFLTHDLYDQLNKISPELKKLDPTDLIKTKVELLNFLKTLQQDYSLIEFMANARLHEEYLEKKQINILKQVSAKLNQELMNNSTKAQENLSNLQAQSEVIISNLEDLISRYFGKDFIDLVESNWINFIEKNKDHFVLNEIIASGDFELNQRNMNPSRLLIATYLATAGKALPNVSYNHIVRTDSISGLTKSFQNFYETLNLNVHDNKELISAAKVALSENQAIDHHHKTRIEALLRELYASVNQRSDTHLTTELKKEKWDQLKRTFNKTIYISTIVALSSWLPAYNLIFENAHNPLPINTNTLIASLLYAPVAVPVIAASVHTYILLKLKKYQRLPN